jgi:hypothetical protein
MTAAVVRVQRIDLDSAKRRRTRGGFRWRGDRRFEADEILGEAIKGDLLQEFSVGFGDCTIARLDLEETL